MENNEDASLEVSVNGEPMQLTRENTTLYTFFGRVMIEGMEMDASNFNHVFVRLSDPDDEENVSGGFIFPQNPGFKTVAAFCLRHNFPAVLNALYLPGSDIDAWNRTTFSDLPNELPEGFE